MAEIVVLTYDHPHRKTQDVLSRLILAGQAHDLHVVKLPWQIRKPRRYLYAHRPGEPGWPAEPFKITDGVDKLFPATRSSVEDLSAHLDELAPKVVIVAGAGILPSDVVQNYKVLNIHPGLLPECRGLDTLKWSLIDGKKVGVTAHICDDRADLGWRVSEAVVPVFRNDTFHSFAQRQYEMELDLLIDAMTKIWSKDREQFERVSYIPGDVNDARRRMPRRIEAGLLEAFERYKLLNEESAGR